MSTCKGQVFTFDVVLTVFVFLSFTALLFSSVYFFDAVEARDFLSVNETQAVLDFYLRVPVDVNGFVFRDYSRRRVLSTVFVGSGFLISERHHLVVEPLIEGCGEPFSVGVGDLSKSSVVFSRPVSLYFHGLRCPAVLTLKVFSK